MKKCLGCLFILLLSVPLLTLHGDAAALNGVLEQQNRILQQNEERQRQFLEERQAPAFSAPLEQPPQLPLEKQAEDAPTIFVKAIEIKGNTLLPVRFIQQLKRDYEGRALGIADINNITRKITNKYTSLGYVTARTLVEPQDLGTGVLTIIVVEGVLEDIIPDTHSQINPRQLPFAFPGLKGKPLNLRDIEQGLDQINRLASRNVTMRIEPGQGYGGSRVIISDVPEKSWRASAGLDNTGQLSTGEYVHTVSLDKDNFLGCFDQLSLSYNFEAPHYFRGVNSDAHGSNRSFNAYLSIPYGYWTFFTSLNRSSYSSEVKGLSRIFTMSGDTESFRMGLERVVHRGANSKTSLGASWGTYQVHSFFEDTRLDASSYFLGTISAFVSHTWRVWGSVVSFRIEPTLGEPWFGAKRDQATDHFSPRSQFRKLSISAQWFKPFLLGTQQFSWESSLTGQWANHTLFGAERYSLGSLYTVRGFKGSPLDGDQGLALRNTLAWSLPLALGKQTQVSDVQIYAGYDWGMIKRDPSDPYEQGHLQGIAVGIRTRGKLSIDCCWAYPVSAPSYVRKVPGVFLAKVSYTF